VDQYVQAAWQACPELGNLGMAPQIADLDVHSLGYISQCSSDAFSSRSVAHDQGQIEAALGQRASNGVADRPSGSRHQRLRVPARLHPVYVHARAMVTDGRLLARGGGLLAWLQALPP